MKVGDNVVMEVLAGWPFGNVLLTLSFGDYGMKETVEFLKLSVLP